MATGNPTLKKVVINGIDVSEHIISFEVTREYNKVVGEATVELSKRVNSLLTITQSEGVGWSITIQRGVALATEEYIFRGEIMSIDESGPTYKMSCADKYYQAVRSEVTTSYDINIDSEAGVLSDIFIDLLSSYTDLTADSTSVQDSGTVLTLKKFICNHADVFERCDSLAGGLNWQHYYDPVTDKIYLEPRGFSTEDDVFTVGDNVVNVPVWTYTKERMINKLTLRGAEQTIQTTVYEDGDNTEAQFVLLDFQPVDMKVYVGSGSFDPTGTGTRPSDNDTNLKVGGKISSTSGTYDYEYDDDVRVKKAFFYDSSKGAQPSLTPAVGTNNIEIQYSYNLPSPVVNSVPTSIDAYGLHQTTHVRTDIKNVSDAEVYVQKTLEYFSEPFISTVLKVSNVNQIKVGRKYRCIDSDKDIDQYLIATKVKIVYPYARDEVTVGDDALKTYLWEMATMDRIKRLEELEGESQDLLLHVVGLDRDITYERRYKYTEVKDRSGDGVNTFILGHPVFGVLGTQELGDAGTAFVRVNLTQGNNIYKEYLYDDVFNDAESFELAYRMDKDSDISTDGVIDASGNSNDGTAANYTANDGTDTGMVYTTDGYFSGTKSGYFDGSTSYINVGDDSSLDITGDISICAWIYVDSLASDGVIFYNGSNEVGGYYFWVSTDGKLNFRTSQSGTAQTTSSTAGVITTGSWMHVMVTRSGTNVNLRKNGIYLGESPSGSHQDPTYGSTWDAYIGQYAGGISKFKGKIADLRLWSYRFSNTTDMMLETTTQYPIRGEDLTSSWELDGDSTDTNWRVQGKVNAGFRFDESINNAIDLGSPTNLQIGEGSFSVSLWINTYGSTGTYQEIYFGGATGGGHGFGLMLESDLDVRYEIYGTTGGRQIKTVAAGVVTDTWYHLVVTFDATTNKLILYKDGVNIEEDTIDEPGEITNAQNFFIGRYYSSTTWPFDGAIDEVEIFSKALSQGEVTTKYNSGAGRSVGYVDWNTTSKTISFTAYQQLLTSQISLGTTHRYFTMSFGSSTGSLTTEISGDNGSTWQTVTLGVRTAFTSCDGTGVLIRISENAGSTATILNTYTSSGDYETPAIKCKLE